MVIINDILFIRSKCCIYTNNGCQYWLRREDLAETGFCKGHEYNYDSFMKQIRICQYPRALNHAVSMLARRPCSIKEIHSRLERLRYTEEVADLVILKLKKEKLVDDQAFCEQWIRFRLDRKYGLSAIRYELKMKGISEDIIGEAFTKLVSYSDKDNALYLARKALKRSDPKDDPRKRRQKVIASLIRKGYDWDTASSAFEKAEKEPE